MTSQMSTADASSRPRGSSLFQHPVLVPALVATVLIALSVAFAAWRVARDAERSSITCTVSPAGEQFRANVDVGDQHLPNGRAGDTYRSDSGCLPIDAEP